MMWGGLVWYAIVWCGMIWFCMIQDGMVWYGMVGSIMLGDDNAATKRESPASRRWSPDGQILYLGYRILSPDHDYLHHMTVLLSLFGCNIGVFFG